MFETYRLLSEAATVLVAASDACREWENHLHVISDDHLTIYSFNQDAEVDQFSKRIGSKYYDRPET